MSAWVSGSQLTELWEAPPDTTLAADLEALGGELVDPWYDQAEAGQDTVKNLKR